MGSSSNHNAEESESAGTVAKSKRSTSTQCNSRRKGSETLKKLYETQLEKLVKRDVNVASAQTSPGNDSEAADKEARSSRIGLIQPKKLDFDSLSAQEKAQSHTKSDEVAAAAEAILDYKTNTENTLSEMEKYAVVLVLPNEIVLPPNEVNAPIALIAPTAATIKEEQSAVHDAPAILKPHDVAALPKKEVHQLPPVKIVNKIELEDEVNELKSRHLFSSLVKECAMEKRYSEKYKELFMNESRKIAKIEEGQYKTLKKLEKVYAQLCSTKNY